LIEQTGDLRTVGTSYRPDVVKARPRITMACSGRGDSNLFMVFPAT